MRDSLESFVVRPGNEAAYQAICDINGATPIQRKILIVGPGGSGKSTLVRGVAEDAIRNGAEMMMFSCSGADMAMALSVDADDSFFERIGETPVLLIDEIAPLSRAEKGDLLLKLLLEERDKHGLTTAITVRSTDELNDFTEAADKLSAFETITMEPLDDNGKRVWIETAIKQYAKSESPTLDAGAIDVIVELFGSKYSDMENAVRYFMTDDDFTSIGTIDAKTARTRLS